jgi:TPR repeat protein
VRVVCLYLDGKPVGFKLLSVAKDNGDKDAEFRYAQLLSTGFVTQPRDVKRALEILESLAGREHKLSQYILGLRHLKDDKVKEGLAFLQRSADNGFGLACAQLGEY